MPRIPWQHSMGMGSLLPQGGINMEYLATFENHTQAVSYARALSRHGIPNSQMPRPRSLAASCGTAVRFVSRQSPGVLRQLGEIQKLYRITSNGYEAVLE